MPDTPGHSLIRRAPSVPTSRFCSCCGLTLAELRQQSRVGCAACYDAFADLLAQSIERLHDATEHPNSSASTSLLRSYVGDRQPFESASLEVDRLHWLCGEGEAVDVILSSRVRLARNLADADFPGRADEASRQRTRERVLESLALVCPHWGVLPAEAYDTHLFHLLRERHLLSYSANPRKDSRALVSSFGAAFSAEINEEDHLRLQSLQPGLALGHAHAELEQLAASLDQRLGFAHSSKRGYLTACPSNLGSGLRASVLLHLPALAQLEALPEVARKVTRAGGLTLRGPHGETSALGSPFVQLSNQVTLGRSSAELVAQVEEVARSLADWERLARNRLLTEQKARLEDTAWRAWGALSHARLMESSECLELLSQVRLGQLLHLLPTDPDPNQIARLLISMEAAHLQLFNPATPDPEASRADWLRSIFGRPA